MTNNNDWTITIKTDAMLIDRLWGNQGAVHTWAEIYDSNGVLKETISFTKGDGAGITAGIPGKFEIDVEQAKRIPTSQTIIDITEAQGQAMIEKYNSLNPDAKFWQENPNNPDRPTYAPPYNVAPGGNGDGNCVTVLDQILQAGGVDYLDGLQTPQGVDARILSRQLGNWDIPSEVALNRILLGNMSEGIVDLNSAIEARATDAAVAALNELQANLENLGNAAPEITGQVAQAAADIAAAASDLVNDIADKAGQAAEDFAIDARNALNNLANQLSGSLEEGAEAAGQILRDGAGRLADLAEDFGDAVGDMLRDAAAGTGVVEDLAGGLAEMAEDFGGRADDSELLKAA